MDYQLSKNQNCYSDISQNQAPLRVDSHSFPYGKRRTPYRTNYYKNYSNIIIHCIILSMEYITQGLLLPNTIKL